MLFKAVETKVTVMFVAFRALKDQLAPLENLDSLVEM